jgi:hypothetical protein
MSRSYKRFAVCKDRNKGSKTTANRMVRRSGAAYSGKSNAYRKLYCSWNIYDYRFVESKKQAAAEYEQIVRAYENGQRSGVMKRLWDRRERSLKEHLNYWARCYYRK